jgi:hypothetical protein
VQALDFQTHKCTNSQADMAARRNFKAILSTFYAGELLETTVADIQSIESGFFNGHFQLAGFPVFCATVFVDCPEHPDPHITYVQV